MITPKPSCSSNVADDKEREAEKTQPTSIKVLCRGVNKRGKRGGRGISGLIF